MRWQATVSAEPLDPRSQLLAEAEAFEQPTPLTRPHAWLWEPASRLFVVTRPELRLPDYAVAVDRLADHGWPVWVRSTGGSAVPLAPGMLVVTQVEEFQATERALATGFERLCKPLTAGLRSAGLEVSTGSVAGAYCDGRYNLVCAGRKVAGTAQRQRRCAPGRLRVMAHAVLLVEAHSRELSQIVYRFYEWAGADRHLDPAAVTTVAEEAGGGRRATVEVVRASIAAALPVGS